MRLIYVSIENGAQRAVGPISVKRGCCALAQASTQVDEHVLLLYIYPRQVPAAGHGAEHCRQ